MTDRTDPQAKVDIAGLFAAGADHLLRLDELAVQNGLLIPQMMELAGYHVLSVFHVLGLDRGTSVTVLCGKGNKGGDGLCAARHLTNAGYRVSVVLADDDLSEHPAHHLQLARAMGLKVYSGTDQLDEVLGALSKTDIIVDALIGYQLNGVPRGRFGDLIELANSSKKPVISCDLPTGLSAQTGELYDPHINAIATVSYAYHKRAFLEDPGKNAAGRIFLVDVGIPDLIYDQVMEGSRPPFQLADRGLLEIMNAQTLR